MDKEIQRLIDDFVTALNDNEEKLLKFNEKVTEIFKDSKRDMEEASLKLERDFNEQKIKEEKEYLEKIKNIKTEILAKTKEKLDDVIRNLR
jgi:phage host-nuclease inhibitor protein Gam